MSYERYLSPNLDRNELAAVVGLVSDTHMPLRRRALPTNLGDVLGGVDFLLHSGDVGELWVLDQLSAIAPVFAVHGNDDTEDAQRELPFQQIIAIAGQRILLWHSHFPNWEEEMAFRADDDLYRSIQRCIDQGQRAGAKIVVFGHWHIPLVYRGGDLLCVNPGALASGNEFTRMLRNTVALLLIEKNGAPHVVHIDQDAPAAPYVPQIDWDAGFQVAGNQFAKSILASELIPAVHFMRANFTRDDILALRPLLAAKAIPIWERQGGELTIADVEDALLNDNTLSLEMRERVQKVWHAWQNSR
jgi:putative phosphoesterase